MARNEVVIRIQLPRWSRKQWVGLIAVLLLAGGAVAWAGLYTPQNYNAGDKLSSARLNTELSNIKTAIDALDARTAGTCPRGYTQFTDNNFPNAVLCKMGSDEMVRVGGWPGKASGPEVFWIDRYEASVWDTGPGGAGGHLNWLVDNMGKPQIPTFPANGQFSTPLFAASVKNVPPATMLTWFQAGAACRLSGKHLATDEEWLAAATGTTDPGANDGSKNALCNTSSSVTGPRDTGGGLSCVSNWGAQDMIGNVWEWTATWYAAPSWSGQPNYQAPVNWGRSEYNDDALWNIASTTADDQWRSGRPAAAYRGGDRNLGTRAGVFALDLNDAPSNWTYVLGFRCVARGM